jgi:hypothetical protein
MIHAREDYNRFQEPDELLNLIDMLCVVGHFSENLREEVETVTAKYRTRPEGATPIAEDEPVMLFRARDKHFTKVLGKYAACVDPRLDPMSKDNMVDAVRAHIILATRWQERNGVKTPDMP